MSTPATVLTAKILARHGSRPDLRLWRNATSNAWVGKVRRVREDGCTVLHPGARMVEFGLCIGSADLVGLTGQGHRAGPGRFVALEVKAGKDTLDDQQRKWLELIDSMGGVAAVVSSVDDVDRVLGAPPS